MAGLVRQLGPRGPVDSHSLLPLLLLLQFCSVDAKGQ
jgi:hypothetical protein